MTLALIKEVTIKGSFRYGVSCLRMHQRSSLIHLAFLSPAIIPSQSLSSPKGRLI